MVAPSSVRARFVVRSYRRDCNSPRVGGEYATATTSDSELLLGDGERFRVLVERHAVALHRYVAARLDVHTAEDVTSETFAIAFSQRARFDARRGSVRAWLFGIATNLVRRHLRSELRMLRAYARSGIDPAAAPSDELAVFDARHARLAGVLAGLRAEHRSALLLTVVAGLSAEEVASALGVPSSTVRAWVARGRRRAVGGRHRAADPLRGPAGTWWHALLHVRGQPP
jgi:RNA polymerase sigma factor (sigma-70 family)